MKGKKESLGREFIEDDMVRFLFHGAKTEIALRQIVHEGFLSTLAGSATGTAYGHGTYFARDANYSLQQSLCKHNTWRTKATHCSQGVCWTMGSRLHK